MPRTSIKAIEEEPSNRFDAASGAVMAYSLNPSNEKMHQTKALFKTIVVFTQAVVCTRGKATAGLHRSPNDPVVIFGTCGTERAETLCSVTDLKRGWTDNSTKGPSARLQIERAGLNVHQSGNSLM
jgi:hypothetical protein